MQNFEDYVVPPEDDPEGPDPLSSGGDEKGSTTSFPFAADLRPSIAARRTGLLVGRILALAGAWGLLGGLWVSDVVYWSGRVLPFPPLEYWTGITLVLLGIPTLVTVGIWRSAKASEPVEIRVDLAGLSLLYSDGSSLRWTWNDPDTHVRLADLSGVALDPPPPERAFSLRVDGRAFSGYAPISETIFLAIVDSARAAGLAVQTHDPVMARNQSPGSEFVHIWGRATTST